MKLNRYQCDRCGRKYDTNKSFDRSMGEEHRLVGIGLINLNRSLHRYDLCDDCLDHLQAWLADPSALIYHTPSKTVPDVMMIEEETE